MKVEFFEHTEKVKQLDGTEKEFTWLKVRKGEGTQVFEGRATEEDKGLHGAEYKEFLLSKDPAFAKAKRIAALKAELLELEGPSAEPDSEKEPK